MLGTLFYFSSFLQVMKRLSVTNASYVVQVQTVGSVLTVIVRGGGVSRTGRNRPISLYFGVPVSILELRLLIHSRLPEQRIGYIFMRQIFVSFASGVLIICEEIAIMAAASKQQYSAVSIAILGPSRSFGYTNSLIMSSAIWQAFYRTSSLHTFLPNIYPTYP